jgi:hypothetical protein
MDIRWQAEPLCIEKAPVKSTACDGLRNHQSEFFEELYFSLVKK